MCNSSPNNKIVDQPKLKAFADRQNKRDLKIKILGGMYRKHCAETRKCRLPKFCPSPTMFSKGRGLRVVKSQDYVLQGHFKHFMLFIKSLLMALVLQP